MAKSGLRSGFFRIDDSRGGTRVGEPACDLDLILGEEAHPVLTGSVQVPEERLLYPVEREKRHGRRDANVHPEHPGLDVLPEVSYGSPALGKDAARVAEWRTVC